MRTGITQDQVNRAADAILGAGENPTVEKVRVELGTGSPNTITRMLDSWRGQLGERLRQLSALPKVPESVGQVMIELWRLATEQAERTLEGRIAKERATLEAARTHLAQERESWEVRLQTAETSVAQAQAARDLAEHVCATLDGQLQDSHALRADLVQQRDRLQDQYDQQSGHLQTLRAQVDGNQALIEADREHQVAHIRALEDRAHQEVDRARQEAKQFQHRLAVAERLHREAVVGLQLRHDAVAEQLRQLERDVAGQSGQVAALEKALAAAYSSAKAKRKESPAASKASAKRSPQKKVPAPSGRRGND